MARDAGKDWSDFDATEMLRRLGSLAPSDITFPQGLLETLQLVRRASLFRDEGRPARFLVAFTPRNVALPSSCRLVDPVDVTANPRRLANLSFATDRWTSCLHVSTDARGRRLVVRGFAAIVSPFAEREFGEQLVQLEALGPDVVRAANVHGAVLFQRGRYLASRDVPEASSVLPRGASAALADSVSVPPNRDPPHLLFGNEGFGLDVARWEEHAAAFRKRALRLSETHLLAGVQVLLWSIQRTDHGGAILWLPTGKTLESEDVLDAFSRAPRAFASVRPSSSHRPWNCDLLATFGWTVTLDLAERDDVGVLDGMVTSSRNARGWADAYGKARVQAGQHAWRAATDAIARLTQVDGALICDALLEPLAFGAFFRLSEKDAAALLESRELSHRGGRHLSMQAAVDAVAGSVGFVVSQDGDVTLLRGHREPAPLVTY